LLDDDPLLDEASPREESASTSSKETFLVSAMTEAVATAMPGDALQLEDPSSQGSGGTTGDLVKAQSDMFLTQEGVADMPLPDFDDLTVATAVTPVNNAYVANESSIDSLEVAAIEVIAVDVASEQAYRSNPLSDESVRNQVVPQSETETCTSNSVVAEFSAACSSSILSAAGGLRAADVRDGEGEAPSGGSSELSAKLAAQRQRSDGEQLAAMLATPKDGVSNVVSDQLAAKLAARRDRIDGGDQMAVPGKFDASACSHMGPMHAKLAARRERLEAACGEASSGAPHGVAASESCSDNTSGSITGVCTETAAVSVGAEVFEDAH